MEVAAGLVVAEQVVSTTIEAAAVAGYALAQKTQPLHATWSRFAVAYDGDEKSTLKRSHHTGTALHGKLYILGGVGGDYPPKHVSNHMHIISLPNISTGGGAEYQCVPMVPAEGEIGPPKWLVDHEARALDDSIFVCKRSFESESRLDTRVQQIFEFNTMSLKWRTTNFEKHPRLANFVVGGDSPNQTTRDRYIVASTEEASYALYQHRDYVGSMLYFKHGEMSEGETVNFPAGNQARREAEQTDPAVPAYQIAGARGELPPARDGAKLLPITTGHGRNYLLLLGGVSVMEEPPPRAFQPDIWALQLPSTASSTTAFKDSARDKLAEKKVPGNQKLLGGDSGTWSWARVVIEPRNEEIGSEGKALPGPLAGYSADVIEGNKIVLWGGADPDGNGVGEGWILEIH